MGKTERAAPHHASRHRDVDAPFSITVHAAEAFRDRIAPGFSLSRARAEAQTLARTARKTEDRRNDGSEIWEATDGAAVRFVVKPHDRVCVTILPPGAAWEVEP